MWHLLSFWAWQWHELEMICVLFEANRWSGFFGGLVSFTNIIPRSKEPLISVFISLVCLSNLTFAQFSVCVCVPWMRVCLCLSMQGKLGIKPEMCFRSWWIIDLLFLHFSPWTKPWNIQDSWCILMYCICTNDRMKWCRLYDLARTCTVDWP